MNDDQPSPHSRRATKTVVDAHLNCLNARNEYIEATNGNLDDGTLSILHQQLQNAVLAYYEALRYNLRTKSSVQDYWAEKTLWTTQNYKQDDHGQILVDDNGVPLVEEVEVKGLKQLDDWFHKQQTSTSRVANSFGDQTVESSTPVKLPVDTLFRIGRLLDEAAEKLGLLTEVKQPVAAPEEAEV